jgi:hypothetical protein
MRCFWIFQCKIGSTRVRLWVQNGWISLVSGYPQPRFGLHYDILSAVLGGADRPLPQIGGSRSGEGDHRFQGEAVRGESTSRNGFCS